MYSLINKLALAASLAYSVAEARQPSEDKNRRQNQNWIQSQCNYNPYGQGQFFAAGCRLRDPKEGKLGVGKLELYQKHFRFGEEQGPDVVTNVWMKGASSEAYEVKFFSEQPHIDTDGH